MTKYVGAVIFEDSTRRYLVYDGMADAAMRPLFSTEKAAQDWLDAGMPKVAGPSDAEASEESVTLIIDVTLEKDVGLGPVARFASRASKKSLWLTGPRSFMEMIYQNGATASRVF